MLTSSPAEAPKDEVILPPQQTLPTNGNNDQVDPHQKPANLPKIVEELIYKHELYNYPELTLLLSVKDAQRTARLIREAGGTVTYDPNLKTGHDIGFLVADLPPEKVLDKEFVKSLEVKALSVDHPKINPIVVQQAGDEGPVEEDLFVPLKDIKVDDFRSRPGNTKGKGVVVAVIDTGVDASHYAFGDRVIYWNDMTREGRTPVRKAEAKEGKISVSEEKEWAVPSLLDSKNPLYVGSFSEKALSVQFPLSAKLSGDAGFDINGNKLFDDEFRFVIGSSKGKPSALIAFVDRNGDGALSESEAKSPVMDFNGARSYTRNAKSFLKNPPALPVSAPGAALLSFPSRSRVRSFPLILTADSEGALQTAAIGIDLEEHGTHVAGIIAGNDGEQIEGAAPEAEIMSFKVCSGITCSEEAIIRGLVEAFYNPQGIVPDVVNISLGSLEGYAERPFNILMRDLAAKFGATFFVSASNDGPGYRSLNSIAATGPVVMVGAYVSRNTLMKHYTLDPSLFVPEHTLHSFTSVGPSYTGQLRPNIVAPGSAISSVPMTMGRSAMFNGTSMASPIAAGSAAALLGLAKTGDDELKKFEERRRAKISGILNNEKEEAYSNISVPLALRTALEDSATKMPHYTAAQRGHGLINIDAAYDKYAALAKRLNDSDTIFADFRVNNNAKGGLYDRQLPIAGAKTVELVIENDGEAVKETYVLNNQALTVSLDRVEVQGSDGSVDVHEKESALKYFAVARRGVEGSPSQTATIILSDAAKATFNSVRQRSAYEAGKTYLAQYSISRAGQRLFSLLDVVHAPHELPVGQIEVDVPGITKGKENRPAAFAVKDKSIGANSFHRYPIAVQPWDGRLSVELAIAPDAGGSVSVQVHDADGKKIGTAAATRSPQLPKEERTVKLSLPVKNSGIYEVIVSAASGRWNGPSKYHLLVQASRYVPSVKNLALMSGGGSSFVAFSDFSTLGGFKFELDPLKRMEQAKVKLVPQRWTFKRVPMPAQSEPGPEFLRVEINTSRHFPDSADFSGDFIPYLYHLRDGKTPEVAYEANKVESALSGGLVFDDVDRGDFEPLYFAVETYENLTGNNLVTPIEHFVVDVVFPDIEVVTDGKLEASSVPSVGTLGTAAVVAPKKITSLPEPNGKNNGPKVRAGSTLRVSSSTIPDLKVEIPISLAQ